MSPATSGRTLVAGVVGAPIDHSLSPAIHSAWIAAARLDAVYAPFAPPAERFETFIEGLRGGTVRGLNVTAPFKERALALADETSPRAARAGAANLLIFRADGAISADNTDGEGLLRALTGRNPGLDPSAGPVVILGAGGAARGAVAALLEAGTPRIDVVNRSQDRAARLAAIFDGRVNACSAGGLRSALAGARLLINATTLGLGGGEGPTLDLAALASSAVVMDMVYRPVRTSFLERAASRGLATVDGLAMLIGQAAPSFRALFGCEPVPIDVRATALAALEEAV
jgi:shikimate dehydrogenase